MSADATGSAAGEGCGAPAVIRLSRGESIAPETAPLITGWLASVAGGPWWQGVVLHDDAMLVRAPRAVLTGRSGQLRVVIGTGDDVIAPDIAEIRLLDVDGRSDPAIAIAIAMLRLRADPRLRVCTRINRDGFSTALRLCDDVWESVRSLGLIPDGLPTQVPDMSSPVRSNPAPVPVNRVQVQPDGWCDIFWWLC
jgi:hypothetical protein